jgi:peptide/nickel transport system substrate-binding protein
VTTRTPHRVLAHCAGALVITLAAVLAGTGLAQTQGGSIRVAIHNMPEGLNPVLPIELNGLFVTGTLFAPIAAVNPDDLSTVPYLAESWEVSDDLKTWTFHLHRNAVWHDGVPITAHDVKFTFDRIADPEEAANAYQATRTWEEVVVVDDHTFEIRLSVPNSILPDVLSSGGFEPLPKHVLEGYERLRDAVEFNTRNPVGSGAFKIRRVDAGSEIEVEAFEDFFAGRPYLDTMVFRIVRDVNAAVAQMLAGDLDWMGITVANIDPIDAHPRLRAFRANGSQNIIMAINMSDYEPWHTMFHDVRVRQAMMYAVDREEIAERIGFGLAPVEHGMMPSSLTWIPEPDIEPYHYDPERAEALLDEAGWLRGADGVREKDGTRLSFYTLVDRGNATREQIGLVLQAAWEAIGMEVEYVVTERTGRWIEETRAGTFPTRITTFPIPNADWAHRLFHTNGLNNAQKYSNPEVDAAIDAMMATADREEQGYHLARMQEHIHADPFIMPFYIEPLMHAVDVSFQDVPPSELKLAVLYAYRIHKE